MSVPRSVRAAFRALVRGSLFTLAAGLAGGSAPAAAQTPTASAAYTGTGQNYVAAIEGFGAIALNPARLGMRDRPHWTLSVPAISAGFGLEPVTLRDLAEYSGKIIPDDIKERWLQRIAANGGEDGLATVAATGFAGTLGQFGVQLSSVGLFSGDLNEDAAEMALFGNRGRTGETRHFLPSSTAIDAFWISSLTVASGFPLDVRLGGAADQQFAVGVALSLSFGHTALVTRDVSGSLEADPPQGEVQFPSIETNDTKLDNGFGVGFGVSAAWEGGPWSVGLNLRNLVNTFAWDFSGLAFRQGEASFDSGSAQSRFDRLAAEEAPDDLQDAIKDSDIDPTLVLGGSYEVSPRVRVLADFEQRFGSGLALTPKTRIGAGGEWGPLSWLTVRGGGSVITDGYRLGGGLGFRVGSVNAAGAYLFQGGQVENADIVSLALSFKAQ